MNNAKSSGRTRVLLCGVFGPYGLDDAYGRKENLMELFHNQVTRSQSVLSLRFHHRSFGLYFIAENIDADATVLDFPTRERFIAELRAGYDVVGISFIMPNFIKAKEMARLVRLHSPRSTIILGGHGAAIEGVEKLIDCDHVVKGEGISWMRNFLGQDIDVPIVHPALPVFDRPPLFGSPIPVRSPNLLVPGLGCTNACRFCSTSHFFGRSYTPYLKTGRELFDVACAIADRLKSDEFFVMDENFLKHRDRADEFLSLMERHRRFFKFYLFSSAEAISAFGVDRLVRLGAMFVWVGVECKDKQRNFEKNRGVSSPELIRSLRSRGICVIASGMLCMEHHTPENIQDDIDYMVDLQADFVQFMLFTPLPTTPLYLEMKSKGLLRTDMPFEEQHGQKALNYDNPSFPGDSAERWLLKAFRQDHERNSSSMYRMMETTFRGYRWLSQLPDRDACIEERTAQLRARVRLYSHLLPVIRRYAANQLERRRVASLKADIRAAIGPLGMADRALRAGALALTRAWDVRSRWFGDVVQPRTIVTHYAG